MTPAKRHDPQVCSLSNLCLSGTGRTEPAPPIIPPELSAAQPGPVPLDSRPHPRSCRDKGHHWRPWAQGLIPAPEESLVAWATPGRPLLQADLPAGLGGLGVPCAPSLSANPCCCSPFRLQAPHSRWPSLAGKQARPGGAGRRSAGGCCVTVSWAACPLLRNLPHSRDRSLGHREGWAPALRGTDTWQPWTRPLPTTDTPHYMGLGKLSPSPD